MELEVILTRLLMAGALTCAIGVCLPDVLLLLGLTRIRRGILGGPEAVRSGPGEVLSEEIAQQLDALDFAPAGLYWEQLPFHQFYREVIFVSRTNDCFAQVFRVLNGGPPCVVFKTSFNDGAFVLTHNFASGVEADEESLRAGGLQCAETAPLTERVPLVEVLEEHRQRVRRFVLAGHDPLLALTMDDLVEAEWTLMDHPTMRRDFHGNVAMLFALKLAFLVGGPAIFALFGVGPGILSALLLAETLIVMMVRYRGYLLAAALDRVLRAEEEH